MPNTIQICSNPDNLSAGDIGRIVSFAGSRGCSYSVRREFVPGPGLYDHGAAKVYIHGCCTMAERIA